MTNQTAPTIQRGEIWNVDFDPQVGAEVRKIRPAVVMSISAAGRLPLHIIVPITTGQANFAGYFWMVPTPASPTNGLDHDSFANAFQVKSVSVNRFVNKQGVIIFQAVWDATAGQDRASYLLFRICPTRVQCNPTSRAISR